MIFFASGGELHSVKNTTREVYVSAGSCLLKYFADG